jgi:hypothetical protein
VPQKLSRSFGSQVAPFPSLPLFLSSSLRQFQIISRTEKLQQAFFKTPTTISQHPHSKAVANAGKKENAAEPPFSGNAGRDYVQFSSELVRIRPLSSEFVQKPVPPSKVIDCTIVVF